MSKSIDLNVINLYWLTEVFRNLFIDVLLDDIVFDILRIALQLLQCLLICLSGHLGLLRRLSVFRTTTLIDVDTNHFVQFFVTYGFLRIRIAGPEVRILMITQMLRIHVSCVGFALVTNTIGIVRSFGLVLDECVRCAFLFIVVSANN